MSSNERVSIISGKRRLIIVAPHGFDGDDENTGFIAERIACKLECSAVINRGWERADKVDIFRDKADCNNVNHFANNVVKEEFLDAIDRCVNKCQHNRNYGAFTTSHIQSCFVLYIHGMSNKHKKIAQDSSLEMVLGYGAGFPNSFTCKEYHRDFLLDRLTEEGFTVYKGKKGGPMSGWSRNNLNQYYRKWNNNEKVFSAQVEIIYDLRRSVTNSALTADLMVEALDGIDIIDSYKTTSNRKYLSY